jgi:hypothetical protein
MKNKLRYALMMVFCTLSMLAISGAAEAYCRWVPTHWVNGHKVAGHQVCTGYNQVRCKTVGGYWRHGYWHDAHRVCWRVR